MRIAECKMPSSNPRIPASLLFAVCILHSAFLLFACRNETPSIPPAREPIAILYVGAPELAVHRNANDASRVTTKFLNGESVSILSKHGDWVEVRTSDGSGWAHAADLTDASVAKAEAENPQPKFRITPSPVTQPGAHGTVYIEASVTNEGDVASTRVITNTTGSPDLADRNAAAMRAAKFYPIVQKGQKKGFIYYYRVEY
jgi:uncharacterized protein YgiM (DUF1202 family)